MTAPPYDSKPLSHKAGGLPSTLQGQLYLAAYDQRRRTFGGANPRLLELALRAAGLTDLYLQGHLIDVTGRPRRAGAPPAPASLRSMWDQVPTDAAMTWAQVISKPRVSTATMVVAELHSSGWLCERRRRLAVIPGRRWQPADTATSDQAGEEARQALAEIVAQQPGTAQRLALGMLAFHAQLPATISVNDDARSRAVLVQASTRAVAPVAGLAEAIQMYFAEVRAERASGAT